MKPRKYKLKVSAKINGEWKTKGTEVDLTESQIERLEKAANQAKEEVKDV